MKLFHFEIKKLLLNKKSLILLAVLFAIYLTLGFFFTLGNDRADDSQAYKSTYLALTGDHAGQFDAEQFTESRAFVDAAIEEYGSGEQFYNRIAVDPILKFHNDYVQYGGRVDEYWNGSLQQNGQTILGVYPLQQKLAELEQHGQPNAYGYRYYQERLNTELKFGEPVFARVTFWHNYLLIFEGVFTFFLLLMVIIYFVAPLFTQEVKTDMDSIILCSLRGRREIATAKLLAAALTSVTIAIVYTLGFSAGLLLGFRDWGGIDAPARCLEPLRFTSLDMTVGGVALFSVLWILFASMVFGVALASFSTRVKSQSAAMGLGIAVLVLSISTDMFPRPLWPVTWPIMDFNFAALASFCDIFGDTKAYNFFGQPLSYGAAAFAAGALIAFIACTLTYITQKKRSAA